MYEQCMNDVYTRYTYVIHVYKSLIHIIDRYIKSDHVIASVPPSNCIRSTLTRPKYTVRNDRYISSELSYT